MRDKQSTISAWALLKIRKDLCGTHRKHIALCAVLVLVLIGGFASGDDGPKNAIKLVTKKGVRDSLKKSTTGAAQQYFTREDADYDKDGIVTREEAEQFSKLRALIN